MAILHGNLASLSAVIKHSATSPQLMRHTGRAVVFDRIEDLTNRIDDSNLDVTADDILVLRNAGPKDMYPTFLERYWHYGPAVRA
jgi:dihydroxy-acid dehydratase